MRRAALLATAALLAAAAVLAVPVAADARAHGKLSTTFTAKRTGEARLALRAWAPGADWGRRGRESAVVTILLDGRYSQDVVLFGGARPFTYRVALGRVRRGRHRVVARFSPRKSPRRVRGARMSRLRAGLAPATGAAALAWRHAPILYGRELSGRYENNGTDTPLLAYHTSSADPSGVRTIEYTVIWSNEDGGTDPPQLMARWGRTTDIEWIYRVSVASSGRVVSAEYQGANHQTVPFRGLREGRHPLLQTATSNNNLTAVASRRRASGYRFFLDPSRTLPAGRAREALMDRNPWTYQVMAKETRREGRLGKDQRNYLYLEVDKDTSYPAPPALGTWVGTALAVKLKGGDAWWTSHRGLPESSIQRDDPAATTVELPPGTTAADVEAIKAVAVPVSFQQNPAPTDWRIDVTSLNRGFLLRRDFTPDAPFAAWPGDVTLTPARPEAVIWPQAEAAAAAAAAPARRPNTAPDISPVPPG